MPRLLYIESSPRKERSASIAVARHFLEVYKAHHSADIIETQGSVFVEPTLAGPDAKDKAVASANGQAEQLARDF